LKLVVISHTEHYYNSNGVIVGWGSTITELNNLIKEFDEITHIAMLHAKVPPQSSLPYTSSRIKFVALPVLGGKSLLSKLKLIRYAPKIIKIVSKEIKKSDIFQLRTPTGIGVFLIPFLTFFLKKKGWYKYAGNWNQENPPLGYHIQRWLLKNQSRIVTINGKWKNQSNNIKTFENPCLDNNDRKIGKSIIKNKDFTKKINYCFVGGLNKNKGVDKIFEAFKEINPDYIGVLHVVGDGVLRQDLDQKAQELLFNVIIHGSLSKTEVQEIYQSSHFILLPSLSEGFPKVIGEAMNFGCVPIVSEISCINQYIQNNKNGFLINPISVEELKIMIEKSLKLSNKEFKAYSQMNYNLAEKFTYAYYLERIKKEILK